MNARPSPRKPEALDSAKQAIMSYLKCNVIAVGALFLAYSSSWTPVIAQDEFGCATPIGERGLTDFYLSPIDTIRACFIFARFKDENVHDYNNAWPINTSATNRDALPTWVPDLLEDAGNGVPSEEGSLAQYFYYMSRGKFRFNCGYYDSTVVLDSSIAWWASTSGNRLYNAVDSVLAKVATTPHSEFSFSDFVTNRRGTGALADSIDCLCVVFRGVAHIN